SLAIRLPDAARHEDFPRREVQVEARRMHIFCRRMMEVCTGIRLIGTLIGRKSDISVDAKHGTANRPCVRNILAADGTQSWSEVSDELQHGVTKGGLIARFVGKKPVPIIVDLQLAKESEKGRLEILFSAHQQSPVRSRPGETPPQDAPRSIKPSDE